MFDYDPLHHVLSSKEESELLDIFEENLDNIDRIEDSIVALQDPKFDSPVWDDGREKLKDARRRLLEVNYKCQILLITVGLMVV